MNLPKPFEYVEFILVGDFADNVILGFWDGKIWHDALMGRVHATDSVFAWRKVNNWEYVVNQQEV